jgi:phosphopantothenoylcysteine decarboxylase/phosphopantothenate--cysteine ligase
MGYRIAEAAWERGANVVLVSGPTTLAHPTGVLVRLVDTTAQLDAVVREELPTADVLIMAAAPADYRPKDPGDHKRPRATGKLAVELEPTEDILSGTVSLRRPQSVIVGFALETGDAEAKGAEKLRRKNLDLIVVNDALEPGAGFEGDTNRVTILDKDGGRKAIPLAGKREVADAILDAVEVRLGK